MKIRFFVDFDGTICLDDLGNKVFIELGNYEPYHKQLINKEISIREYWHKLCESLNTTNSFNEIREIAKKSEIDYYFLEFYNWAQQSDYETCIVSDGFSIYIDEVLRKYGIREIKKFSNHLVIEGNKVLPYFPEAQEDCHCLSASCKRNIVLNNSDDDDLIVYIGDGYSDFCPAEYSDIVFAKKNLAAYCNEYKIPHYPYKNFFDVKMIMSDLIIKKKIKKRNVASIKRKNAFENE